MMRVPFAAFAAVSGCVFGGIPNEIAEEDLARVAAPVLCNRVRECDRGTYDSVFFGAADCRDEWEHAMDLVVQSVQDLDCEYDAAGAGAALDEISQMSCEDFVEAEGLDTLDLIWADCFLAVF
jgi:hypothetical protein